MTAGYTVERYFALVAEGVLDPDDRVELLEGVIVAMSPRNTRHDAAINRASDVLHDTIGTRAAVRVQSTLIVGRHSVPEPDVLVVPGRNADYDRAHPRTGLLVIEVSDTSLAQDRITKAAIYAAAGIPEYWIINLRDDRVEVLRSPDSTARVYRERTVAGPGDRIELVALPGRAVAVDDLLPAR